MRSGSLPMPMKDSTVLSGDTPSAPDRIPAVPQFELFDHVIGEFRATNTSCTCTVTSLLVDLTAVRAACRHEAPGKCSRGVEQHPRFRTVFRRGQLQPPDGERGHRQGRIGWSICATGWRDRGARKIEFAFGRTKLPDCAATTITQLRTNPAHTNQPDYSPLRCHHVNRRFAAAKAPAARGL